MKIEEIKVGQKVAFIGTVEKINLTHADVRAKDEWIGIFNIDHLQPYTEPVTERLFKKGDIVRRIDTGNEPSYENTVPIGAETVVIEDEDEYGDMIVHFKKQYVHRLDLELVIPVEEREALEG